jgi:hypothetical protein
MDLESVADELYGLVPSEFTAARDARAADAKSSGDQELARSIKQLRRPTAGAWLANLLSRRRPAEITQLLDLGAAMRQAQSDLAADDMRALSTKRRQLVTALAAEARSMAAKLGQKTNDSTIQELEETLEAALADPAAAESLQSGRLITTLRYSGFGPVDLTGTVAVLERGKSPKSDSRKGPAPPKAHSSAAQRKLDRRVVAEQVVRDAEAASAIAERSALTAQQRLDKATKERDRMLRQVANTERQLKALQETLDRAERARSEAQTTRDESERSTTAATRRVARARSELDRI